MDLARSSEEESFINNGPSAGVSATTSIGDPGGAVIAARPCAAAKKERPQYGRSLVSSGRRGLFLRGLEMSQRLFGVFRRDVGVLLLAVVDGHFQMRNALFGVLVRLLGLGRLGVL